jgi:short-subunit dehydrogenase
MNTTSTFAIDVSVYVATKDSVTKYTAGLRDDFKLTIPGEGIEITKVITHTDQTKLYLWDKKMSALYISSREGVYERQVVAPLFSQATDVEVYNDVVYLLKGSKLYSIEL